MDTYRVNPTLSEAKLILANIAGYKQSEMTFVSDYPVYPLSLAIYANTYPDKPKVSLRRLRSRLQMNQIKSHVPFPHCDKLYLFPLFVGYCKGTLVYFQFGLRIV
jgi:hypothetical protein